MTTDDVNKIFQAATVKYFEDVGHRVQIAEQMLKKGLIKTSEEYFQIINTGKIDTMFEGVIEIKCSHHWKEYIGFTERYKYCTKCDSKDNQ